MSPGSSRATVIRTTRLALRAYEPADWDAFRELVQQPDLMERLSGALSSDAARRLFDRLLRHDRADGLIGWAVTKERDAAYCGHVFLHNFVPSEGSVELGFVLLNPFHRQGFAAEAAAAVLCHARTALGCRVVRATVDEDHAASKAVLARIGMTVITKERDTAGEYLVYATP